MTSTPFIARSGLSVGLGATPVGIVDSSGNIAVGGGVVPGASYPLEISSATSTSIAYQRTGVSAKKWSFSSDNNYTYWNNVTDGVTAVSLSNAGLLNAVTLSAGNNIVTGTSSNNPERGAWNPIYSALAASKPMYTDEEFQYGVNSINVYNNFGGIKVTVTREAMDTPVSITTASWAANVISVTNSAVHGLNVNDTVTIENATPVAYNGTYTVASTPTTSSWTAADLTNPGTYTSGGTTRRLTIPNKSGYRLKIFYDGTGTYNVNPTPGYGGFILNINPVANRTYVQRFRACVPVGYTLVLAENSQGTNNLSYWMTPVVGTGKYEEYIRVSHCGNTGSFSVGGHVYLSDTGGGNKTIPWYLASCNVYEIDNSGINDMLTNGFNIQATTASTTSANGALTVAGGVGISGALNTALDIQVGSNTGGTRQLAVNSAVGNSRFLAFQTAGVVRWAFAANTAAEAGSNAGSDLILGAYADGGSLIDTPITIARAAGGYITFNRNIVQTTGTYCRMVADGVIARDFGSNASGIEMWSYNATGTMYINQYGYQGGTTQYRNLSVGDGQAGTVFSVVGSTKAATFNGAITSASFTSTAAGNGFVNIAGNSASADPYGTIAVTNPNSANNYTYFGMTRASTLAIGIGINTSNLLWIGAATGGSTGSVSSGSHWFTLNGAGGTFLGTMTSAGIVTTASSSISGSIAFKSAPDSQTFSYQTAAGASRWASYLSGAESSGDAGSNLIFVNYNDAGTFKNVVLNLNRATGNIATNSPNFLNSSNSANVSIFTSNTATIDIGGSILLGGYFNGTSQLAPFGSIRGAKENSTSNNYDGYLQFNTILNGGILTERLRISSVGIATFSNQVISKQTVDTASIGSELIATTADRDFSSNSGHWSLGTGWTISGGLLSHAAGNVTAATLPVANVGITSNAWYQITFTYQTITPTTGNGVYILFGAATDYPAPSFGTYVGSGLTYTAVVYCTDVTGGISINTDAVWAGNIDNISVMKITAATPAFSIKDTSGVSSDLTMGNGGTNTGWGKYSLLVNATGGNNTAFGKSSQASNVSGTGNSTLGYYALRSIAAGNYNATLGDWCLYQCTNSMYNSALGSGALKNLIEGDNNAAMGANAGDGADYLSQCSFLGSGTDATNRVVNGTAIGYGAIVTTSNTIQLGNGSVSLILTAGVYKTTNSTTSSSTTTGSIITAGGIGAAGAIYAASFNGSGTGLTGNAASLTAGIANAITVAFNSTNSTFGLLFNQSGGPGTTGSCSVSNISSVYLNASTGALTAASFNTAGIISTTSTTATTSTSTGAIVSSGGIVGNKSIVATGVTTLTPATTTTVTIDCSLGNLFIVNLPASGTAVTIGTPTNPVQGQSINILFTQGTAFSTTLTWPANTVIIWVGGNKTITATTSSKTMVSMVYTGGIWWASMGNAMA